MYKSLHFINHFENYTSPASDDNGWYDREMWATNGVRPMYMCQVEGVLCNDLHKNRNGLPMEEVIEKANGIHWSDTGPTQDIHVTLTNGRFSNKRRSI